MLLDVFLEESVGSEKCLGSVWVTTAEVAVEEGIYLQSSACRAGVVQKRRGCSARGTRRQGESKKLDLELNDEEQQK